jgi:hypothetical protein
MKVKYIHPAIVPEGIELDTEYDLVIKGDTATIKREGFSKEFTKYQADMMFEPIDK